MDVKAGKQIKRDELALAGLGLDLWRENKSVKAARTPRPLPNHTGSFRAVKGCDALVRLTLVINEAEIYRSHPWQL